MEIMRSEVHALPPSEDLPSITELSLDLLINIKPKDVRTFLGNEIPGLALYHTEIAVAGKGTNITNLPIESPPPQFELLEDTNETEDNKTEEQKGPKSKNKTVFIYHSHSWEAYKPLLKNANQTSSNNEKTNVIAVGEKLKSELEDKGIGVEHSKKNVPQALTSRNWNYYQSYALSRETVQEAMANNDKLKFFIDIHRDAQPKKVTTAVINQKKYAKLFFVVGKEHKGYEMNRTLAEKLHSEIEKKYPGISRGVFIKGKSQGDGVYNQDLSGRALLIEFGGVDNDLTELYNSTEALADIFSEFYWGDSEI
ncbi:stage II sporulation protein P [Siminovitchia acidinfaciens]|uniref:Stage II sporulation protein P n=1 Tax=Siminovitchia acidinfaciens TaxID=2321395 RepID=A0A429Y598_9BACI|nr:stage II sporulation protein P [Siminovitchia acidinfaciens]